ncbi:MDR family MFS transporter [uncultured Jatrophihabitans sp.]|uniref:MDR family MFS transporter n=1 Tax=uncultured Jatrophihabitans sp. TaxID=1610747 RepID=UPI0035C94867
MTAVSLVAIDATIIATAVPSIVSGIGGFAQFPWLFSVYLLAQAVTVPVYGKLADLFGRKPVMLFGIAAFFAGSIACGLAWSMPALIVFRAVQGIGAGAIQPMSLTIVGDLYSVQERAKVQGYLASVWGAASVIGPTLGGVFSEYVSWRWIFFVNIPFCVLAAAMIGRRFHEKVERSRPRVDYRGATLLTSGLTLLILGVLEGGQAWRWASVPGVAVPVVGLVLLAVFVAVETRVAEPILPLWVFRRRLLVTTAAASFAVGGVLIGLSSYVPTYVQDVVGTGPLVAGFALATLTIGWPISASQAGKLYLRIGVRSCAFIGSALTLAGSIGLTALGLHSGVVQTAATCFVIGLGMGLVAAPTMIAAQSSVDWQERGVVTGANMFARSLGSALAIAVFGAVANATLGGATSAVQSAHADPTRLDTAVHHVFIATVVLAAVMGLVVALMPRNALKPAAGAAGASGASGASGAEKVPDGTVPA